ncbi:MAG: hypothetical protein HY694_12600 [Deltaproteobacteria bacterium]|nr:hypothetical protein [Deltaproteobacteria bacterium]
MQTKLSWKDAKALTAYGSPAEQVSVRPRSCAPVVEHCLPLHAQRLARQVGAGSGRSAWTVDIAAEGRTIRQELCLDSSPMPWGGGVRFCLVCSCGRRCDKLLLPPGKDQFACRCCHGLLYWAQRYKTRQILRG